MLPNKQTKLNLAILLIAAALSMAAVGYAAPMGTAFSYQGKLSDAGSPADGLYDFTFEVYDALDGGRRQGSTLFANKKDVINGYFTVTLDFGAGVFTGDARWLQIAVRPRAGVGFTTLRPRQEITPVPYAMQTRGIFVDQFGKVGIGTEAPAEKLDVQGYIRATGLRSSGSIYNRSDIDMEFTIDAGDSSGLFAFFEIFNGKGQHAWFVNENGDMRNFGDAIVDGDMLVKGNLIAEGSLGRPVIRSINIPAGAFNLSPGVTADYTGAVFPTGYTHNVNVLVPIPRDWDGSSDFKLTVFFSPGSNSGGVVAFFVRIAGRKAGDIMGDPGSTSSTGVFVNNGYLKLYKQSFTIPASKFAADDEIFHIYSIQRGGTGETYAGSVSLKTVEISYTAKR